MRTIALALALGTVVGCAVSTERFYLPTDPKYAQTGSSCGFVPWGQTRLPLAESLSAAVDLRPVEGRVGLSIQLALPQGTAVRFSEPVLRLQNQVTGAEYTARLNRFRVSVYGRGGRPGHQEHVNAEDVLEGKGRNAELAGPDTQYAKRDLFISTATFSTEPAAAYLLKVPAIEINGILRAAQEIPVTLIEKTGVLTCVQ